MLTSRYIDMYARFHAFTDEYRKLGDGGAARKDSLRKQISLYRKRIALSRAASRWLNIAVITFILTVGCTCLAIAYPKIVIWPVAGFFTTWVGLGLLVLASIYELRENAMARHAIMAELSDVKDQI
jgi:hypothetical protein